MGRFKRLSEEVALQEYMPPQAGCTRVVVCAANRFGDVIIPGPRHYSPTMVNLLRILKEEVLEYIENQKEEQGFIDQWGNFMSREEALVVARNAGQLSRWREFGGADALFSEDLY